MSHALRSAPNSFRGSLSYEGGDGAFRIEVELSAPLLQLLLVYVREYDLQRKGPGLGFPILANIASKQQQVSCRVRAWAAEEVENSSKTNKEEQEWEGEEPPPAEGKANQTSKNAAALMLSFRDEGQRLCLRWGHYALMIDGLSTAVRSETAGVIT
ncbi:hypothetical protein BDR04DRAFT_1156228 [Suillus decipiens]|nr:hypothetical protein BDR04DRAFT_1156228 [Suillus decipiens]